MSSNRTVFEILAIEPTNDFEKVKKAYKKLAIRLHPDKHQDEQAKYHAMFLTLHDAFELVDSQEKLTAYLTNKDSSIPKVPTQQATNFTPTSNVNSSDAIKVHTVDSEIDVFLPVSFHGCYVENDKQDKVINLQRLDPKSDFVVNLEDYVTLINETLKMRPAQIGVTFDEAIEMANQHSFSQAQLIVQFKVSVNRLSELRISEKDRDVNKNILNAKDGQYFWLEKNTVIKTADILSIQAMKDDDYHNTRRFKEEIKDFWPKNFCYKTSNPNEYSNLMSIANKEYERLQQNKFFAGNKTDKLKKAIEDGNVTKIKRTLETPRFPKIDWLWSKITGQQVTPTSQTALNSNNQAEKSGLMVVKKS